MPATRSPAQQAASRANGGLIGPINVEDLEPTLRAQVEKMKPGDVTVPVRTQSGYRIFQIETLSPRAGMVTGVPDPPPEPPPELPPPEPLDSD